MKITKAQILIGGIACIGVAQLATAYELTTHAAITRDAYARSSLALDRTIARSLGIDWFLVDPGANFSRWDQAYKNKEPFGSVYMDTNSTSSGDERSRPAVSSFEGKIIQGTLGVPPLTLPGWLMRGAIREDDSRAELTGTKGEPFDDPYGDFNRWCNHFFDPTKAGNRAATFFCFFDVYQDAANWAMGTNDAFANPQQPLSDRRNHFTAVDAREALYRAVTGKRKNGTAIGSGVVDADFNARKAYYATVFRALGDVLHLNQDMAQPQHTKDESHAGIVPGSAAFERRIDARAKGVSLRGPDGSAIDLAPLAFAGYATPRFERLSDYWTTSPGQAIPSGKGLADYSNRGFFTVGNNFGSTKYQSPPSDPGRYSRESRTIMVGGTLAGTMTYLRGTIWDNQSNAGASALLSLEGVWKDLTNGAVSVPAYTQDKVVFDDNASLLLPRAAAYSAGILDYFFRGRMQISAPDGGVYGVVDHSKINLTAGELLSNFKGFSKLKIKLAAPDTGNDGLPQTFGGGTLLAVVKFRRNVCFDNELTKFQALDEPDGNGVAKYKSCRTEAEEIIVSDPVNGGAVFTPTTQPQPLTLNFSKALPLNATDVRLQVVYRGKLGSEDDEVVVATQDLSEPSYFSYINASDYWTIDMGAAGTQVFTRSEINASQTLLQKVYPQSCVDKTVSPWQLKPSCLQPFDVRLGLRVGAFKIDVQALPLRRLARIAFLANADTQVSLAQPAENTCMPQDPFVVDTSEWQSSPDVDNNPSDAYPRFQKIRGVWGWYGTSCVGNASGLAPGLRDNRNEVMTELASGEKVPFEVTIDDGDAPQ